MADHARDPQGSGTGFSAPPMVPGLSHLVGGYDLVLCDVWGVVHNGVTAFPATSRALDEARALGKSVVLVSNAPRPHPFLIQMLDNMGVPRSAYDAVVTSGDVTRGVLEEHPGAKLFHLGPPRDLGTFEGLNLTLAPLEDADIVACTGLLDDDVETPDDYVARLKIMKARNLTFLCANPDIVVERGDKLIYCAGAIAKVYEEMGGKVVYCGKPYPPIYATALKTAETLRGAPVDASKVLAIGDALHTDIRGANAMGFDALFIASGIHAVELKAQDGAVPDSASLAELFSGEVHPKGVMPRLAW